MVEITLWVMNDLRSALRAEAVKIADQFYESAMRLFAEQMANMFGSTPAGQAGATAGVVPARSRLSQEHLEEVLATVIELLEKNPGGLRSEQIRSKLNIDKKTFQMAMHIGKQSDQVVQSGERRATVYALPGRPSKAQEEGRVVRGRKKRG